MLDKINHNEKLYIIKCGAWYTCLSFAYAESRRAGAMAWTGATAEPCEPGTPEHFAAYERAIEAGAAHAAKTHTRCPHELCPQLIGLEGARVEVTRPDGEKSRFWVGRSLGWLPCHLEMKTRRSTSGCPAYVPHGSSVRVIDGRR